MESETAPVQVVLSNIRRLRGSPVKMLFDVEIEIAGIPLKICGFAVISHIEQPGKISIRVPHHRDQTGAWAPSLGLPSELHGPIMRLAFEQLGLGDRAVIAPAAA